MDWVHCNNCYIQPGEGKKFLITNCGHIFCLDCASLEKTKECLVCQSPCRNMLLSSKMSTELEMYFCEPFENIQNIAKVLEFQKNHRIRLTNFRKGQLNSLNKENSLLKEQIKKNEHKILTLQEENKKIKIQLLENQHELENLKQKITSGNVSSHQIRVSSNGPKKPTDQYTTLHGRFASAEKLQSSAKKPYEGFRILNASTPKNANDSRLHTPSPLSKILPQNYRISNIFQSAAVGTHNSDGLLSSQNPFLKKIKLPEDIDRPSRAELTALHRLTLAKQPSASKKIRVDSSNYSDYFKSLR